ncbi:casein kinase substrate phosphoprotein PP28-domain-containing protein [Limtongia smithiae]|uniref:casein kinase substrate phosphoprotein PP28-domain-containing protein n=1 Tax=Limtongia smithiae TaxID=1125753 RepID=UPI0034D00D65
MPPRGKSKKPSRGGGKHFSRGLREQSFGDDAPEGVVVPEGADKESGPWRQRRASVSSSSSEASGSGRDSDSEADDAPRPPPVATANPNRDAPAASSGMPTLSRREREAMQAAAAKERYWKLHEQGKTDQARADLARLAVIRKEREEKARQRKAEMEAKAAEQDAKVHARRR